MKGSNWVRFQDGLQGAVCGYIPGRVEDNDASEFYLHFKRLFGLHFYILKHIYVYVYLKDYLVEAGEVEMFKRDTGASRAMEEAARYPKITLIT